MQTFHRQLSTLIEERTYRSYHPLVVMMSNNNNLASGSISKKLPHSCNGTVNENNIGEDVQKGTSSSTGMGTVRLTFLIYHFVDIANMPPRHGIGLPLPLSFQISGDGQTRNCPCNISSSSPGVDMASSTSACCTPGCACQNTTKVPIPEACLGGIVV